MTVAVCDRCGHEHLAATYCGSMQHDTAACRCTGPKPAPIPDAGVAAYIQEFERTYWPEGDG